MSGYQEAYAAWARDPKAFWGKAADAIDWISPPTSVFDPDQGVYGRWFAGATCNTAWNCLDRHVATGRGDQPAIHYDSPVTGTRRTISYAELTAQVQALAAVLLDNGISAGDRVIIYMPMIPEALMSMLACARIGAIHSVVFGGFAGRELATRIDDATPRAIISASCGIEPSRIVPYEPLIIEAMSHATHQVEKVFVFEREQQPVDLKPGRDIDMGKAMAAAMGRKVDCVPVAATDPAYILYTSGTTGQPKGVVRDTGGHMVALAWTMGAIYDIGPGDVFWAASDVGWVVGHSYIVYAPLLVGATTIIYEGKPVGTPDAGAFWRMVDDYGVKALFTAPTAFRAIKKEDPEGVLIGRHDISSLKALFLAGERADPDTVKWAETKLGVPVIDHWWQTETGWAIAANPMGLGLLPFKYGSPTVPMPGYAIEVLDDAGHAVAPGTLGNIVVRLPLPPGCLPTLWNADGRFHQSYLDEFPGYYKTADAGIMDADGYLFIMSRTDDIINVAGHRLSTGGMEEVLSGHQDVAECAVIGIADALKGQAPCGFVVLKRGVAKPEAQVEKELIQLVRDEIGPVAAFKLVFVIERLPKTRSGKILRGTMRQIADREPFRMPATIDDPAILDEIRAVIDRRLPA